MEGGILARYRDLLPVTDATPQVTLGEGDTPLVRSRHLEKELGCGELFFKLEGCNPTGSFKDRGMVLAVAKAMEAESNNLICASTGNTSASAAAYGARCGLPVVVIIPKGKISLGKLVQAVIYGARIITIDGNFDQALSLVRQLAEKFPVTLVNSINPYRLEGQKSAAFEIVDVLGDAPDYLFIPVGNAGNITAYWKGFTEYHMMGKARHRPKMMGFEAEGAAAIVRRQIIEEPATVASAIRIGNPANWKGAEAARDESEGVIDCVSDEEILAAYQMLASKEGIFGEPASGASVAGLMKLRREGTDFSQCRVVCVITGSGLKDPDVALRAAPSIIELPVDLKAVEEALGWA
jgi:threonine synthase